VDKATLQHLPSFVTADGSTIRELAGPTAESVASAHQSLAEARLGPGSETAEHYHPRSEELYYFVSGRGRMRLGDDEAEVAAGDCVVIEPGTPHKLFNDDDAESLVLLCCCSPPYSHDDTVMTGR
jgi:mannose-6-phosphate isomerase-like protein (cupin superfamily)